MDKKSSHSQKEDKIHSNKEAFWVIFYFFQKINHIIINKRGEIMSDTTLVTLLFGLIMGVAGNALYEMIKYLVQHPRTPINDALDLPQARVLKGCIIISLIVGMYTMVQL
jgi:hypothetical protein